MIDYSIFAGNCAADRTMARVARAIKWVVTNNVLASPTSRLLQRGCLTVSALSDAIVTVVICREQTAESELLLALSKLIDDWLGGVAQYPVD